MDPLSQVFCLRWNNHRSNLLSVFDHLLQTEAFCDVTLACDGSSIKCHKMILSACSSYFQTLFMENTCEHPIVFLKDIKYNEIRAILDYMYKGEVNVAQEELPGLLKVAELLKVKGLVEEEREKLLNSKEGRPLVTTVQKDEGKNGNAASISALNGDSKPPRKDEQPKNGGLPVSPASMRPGFNMYGQGAGLPIWPLSGMFPGAHNLFGGNDTDRKEGSQSPSGKRNDGSSHKRKKMASGSNGHSSSSSSSSSSREHNGISPSAKESPGDRSRERLDRDDPQQSAEISRNDSEFDEKEDNDKGVSPGIANYVPNQRLEWKRYKQYTRNDIMAAIDEVRKGMSALQASRKFGVPSRTLYDKVKKMGITTGRQMQRKSMPQYPASFPSLNSLSDPYKDNDDIADNDLDSGRPSLVAPAFPSYMLNIMEKMKEAENEKQGLSPMNLSNMLSTSREGNNVKRSSEGSAPQSPSSGEHESVSSDHQNADLNNGGEIRAQFMADLRRLGGNIPVLNDSRSYSDDNGPVSPPQSAPDKSSDNFLPPRKRKVSHEHHLQALLTAAAAASAAEKKLNGDADEEEDDIAEDEREEEEEAADNGSNDVEIKEEGSGFNNAS